MLFFRFIYIWILYMRNILWCIYWECVQAAGVSASFSQRGGGGACCGVRRYAPPPPCWRLTLLDTQAQQCGGGGGGVTRWSREVGEAVGHSHSLLLDLSCPTLFYRHPRWLNASPAPAPTLPRPPTKCCNLTSLTKGNIYEQDWLACRVAECHFSLHPQQLLADT